MWLHSIAVATVAETLARSAKAADLPPDEAFVCGLLHDVGKLALDHVLPRGYSRVVELTEVHQRNVAEFERKVIGLDHHTAGKRLAEQWGLPLRLQDCIWLHGSPIRTLPDVDHRRMIGLIRLADLVVRRQHVGYSGNHLLAEDPAQLAASLGLDPKQVEHASASLFAELETRGKALGLHDTPSDALRLLAMERANAELGAMNASLERRTRQSAVQGRVLEAIADFQSAATPAASLGDVLDTVARSAAAFLGNVEIGLITPGRVTAARASWRGCRYDASGRPTLTREFEPGNDADRVLSLSDEATLGAAPATLLPWVPPQLLGPSDGADLRLLPLPSGWGTAAWLVHGSTALPPWALLRPLVGAWGAAIASAKQYEGARHLGEQLAESNAALADAQDRLTAAESLSRLGEMAAGAAHEMNNPLSIIAGRSQVLTLTLPEASKERASAQAIFREAHRLSDLISSLRMVADPPAADRKPCDLRAVIERAVEKVRHPLAKQERPFTVRIDGLPPLPVATVDAEQVERALMELLMNAVQAEPASAVAVSVQHVESEAIALIRVTDDASGMDAATLRHAFDPFFSARTAGRQLGMGLPRARQFARAHGGEITLRSEPGRGTEATFLLPLDCPAGSSDETL